MGDYDDDERPDWREMDRRRDRSTFYGRQEKGAGKKKEAPKDRWQQGRVKDALGRLFKGDKGTPEHDKLYARLHNAYGSEAFAKQAEKYMAKFGLPDDAATLILFMDLKDADVCNATLNKLLDIYPTLQLRQQEDVRRKISIAAMGHRIKEIRVRAGEIIEQLD
ncbi:MAG: hypothetical protein PHT96_14720 [Syntrophorhabdaceae bacterium]|nr:hypothetical protein [Syntrophorhabdaceae bacterium]MDD4197640.1 hypothetical protein [Syntrophorhabdaceae bacterium]